MALKTNEEMAQLFQDAITALLTGGAQSYRIGQREVTRADLRELRRGLEWYKTLAERDKRGGMRVKRAVPRD